MLLAALIFVTPLLDGVQEIASPGVPGPLVVFGEQAEVVVSAKQGRYLEPVVASAVYGKGRVVAFGHGGYFGKQAMAIGQTRQLLINSVRWAATRSGQVGVHRATEMEEILAPMNLRSRRLSELDLANLDGISLLIIDPNGESEKHAETIQKFVQDGGGLIIAGLGWGWLQLNPGRSISEHPCNRITQPMGIAWADGYLERNTSHGISADAGPKDANAFKAAASLGTLEETAQAGQSLTRAIATLGAAHPFVISLTQKLAKGPLPVPKENAPLTLRDVSPRLRFALSLQSGKPTDAHPSARIFPGFPSTEALTVSKTLSLDLAASRWHSTGLYALAGVPVRVTVSEAVKSSGLQLRIGAHTDSLWELDEWKRAPEITTSEPIVQSVSEFANPFGGSVYIEVPEKSPGKTVSIRIDNAIESPYYVHGKTSQEDWLRQRNAAGPWAELETSKIALTVPSETIRNLDDPKALMDFWDRVADACADFAGFSRIRNNPERYVADVQISAGYMHAGYPIMTHLDAAPRMVDLALLTNPQKGGDWGLFHEIGHNHQEPEWTFEGTGEVTNNLFTLYIIETVVGRVPAYEVRWEKQQLLELFRKHRSTGANFDKWKSDPFLALAMYVQMQQAFGWEPFKKVFADYRKMPQSEKPKSDAEKRDQWLIRFSRAAGKNLSPFFDAWGVPVSPQAKRSLNDLPTWDFPK